MGKLSARLSMSLITKILSQFDTADLERELARRRAVKPVENWGYHVAYHHVENFPSTEAAVEAGMDYLRATGELAEGDVYTFSGNADNILMFLGDTLTMSVRKVVR